MVGYGCSLKLAWLNHAVHLLSEDLSESEYKGRLNEYLAFEIDGETRLRKTREILMNIWYYDSKEISPVRQEALKLLADHPDDVAAIHLSLIYLTYPVVADVCKYMGRMFEFQDDITNTMLRQKLYDEWGERGTLQSICRRVTLTLKELDILTALSRTRYVLKKHHIAHQNVVNYLLAIAMRIDGGSYYSFTRLTEFNVLFPFEYAVSKEQLMLDNRFTLNNYDWQLSVALRK